MKTILLLLMAALPFFTHAMQINWNMGSDPASYTVKGGTIGAVTQIVLLDVTAGLPTANSFWDQAFWKSDASYDPSRKNVITTNKTKPNGIGFDDKATAGIKKIVIAVIDADGKYLASSVLNRGNTVEFLPKWVVQSDGSQKAINQNMVLSPFQKPAGWEVSGQLNSVPEPSVLASVLLGATLMLVRRKRRA